MAKKKIKKPESIEPAYPKVLETFRDIGDYYLSQMKQEEPSSFNGNVQVRRYRVTVELIDEPNEIIAERIERLWINCDNHHHWQPLKNAATKIGYEIKGEFGSQLKNKKHG